MKDLSDYSQYSSSITTSVRDVGLQLNEGILFWFCFFVGGGGGKEEGRGRVSGWFVNLDVRLNVMHDVLLCNPPAKYSFSPFLEE